MQVINEDKLKKMSRYIHDYIDSSGGISPKLIEIAEYMGMHISVAYRYLMKLSERGDIEYNGRCALRASSKDKVAYRKTPILGTIACGTPEDNRQDIQGYVAIPTEWLDGECYLLRASGDSMIDVGIDDGDLVLIKLANEAYNGQIVATLTEDGTTLKRYINDGVRAYLHAENKTYTRPNIYPQELTVQGIALKVIKDLR